MQTRVPYIIINKENCFWLRFSFVLHGFLGYIIGELMNEFQNKEIKGICLFAG